MLFLQGHRYPVQMLHVIPISIPKAPGSAPQSMTLGASGARTTFICSKGKNVLQNGSRSGTLVYGLSLDHACKT